MTKSTKEVEVETSLGEREAITVKSLVAVLTIGIGEPGGMTTRL